MTTSRQTFFLNEAIERRLGFSRAVRVGDLLFISGTVSIDRSGAVIARGDMRGQLETIYANLASTLEHFNVGLESIVKETIFTTDMNSFLGASAARAAVYRETTPPATTGVEVSALALPDLLVEIEAVAHLVNVKRSQQ